MTMYSIVMNYANNKMTYYKRFLQKSILFIYCGIISVKHAFYLFSTCGYLEIDFYFQSLLNRKAIYGDWISTVDYKLFIIIYFYNVAYSGFLIIQFMSGEIMYNGVQFSQISVLSFYDCLLKIPLNVVRQNDP